MSALQAILLLYESEINCGITTFWDGGIDVYIGDPINGIKERVCFDESKASDKEIAKWLCEAACRHWPESLFAKDYRDPSIKVN